MSGNNEREPLKLYVWYNEEAEEDCECRLVAVAHNIDEARKKAVTTISAGNICAWCLGDCRVYDVYGDIEEIPSWKLYIAKHEPTVYSGLGAAFFI